MESSKLIGNQQIMMIDGKPFLTLKDILPDQGPMKMLIVAKTPAPTSVNAGHYFQGKQGRMFWNMLKEYNLMKISANQYEDDHLLCHGYGITDIVKMPHKYAKEPTIKEYRQGAERIIALIDRLQPDVVMFVYKKVLDNIIKELGKDEKSEYGFNPKYESLFGSKVFVFPMPGTPCTKVKQLQSMNELASMIK